MKETWGPDIEDTIIWARNKCNQGLKYSDVLEAAAPRSTAWGSSTVTPPAAQTDRSTSNSSVPERRFKGGKVFRLRPRSENTWSWICSGDSWSESNSWGTPDNQSASNREVKKTGKNKKQHGSLRHKYATDPAATYSSQQDSDEDWYDKRCIPRTPPPTPAIPSEYIHIRPSDLGGLGIFAARPLKRGDRILVEKPLLRTTNFRFMMDFCNLSKSDKASFMRLHGSHGMLFERIESIRQRNAFKVRGGIAIFKIASRFNHACPPVRNVQYEFDEERGEIVFMVCHDEIPVGTELLINYGGSPEELYRTYGFICRCGGCKSLTEEELRILRGEVFDPAAGW